MIFVPSVPGAERYEPHGGRDQIGHESDEIGFQRWLQRNAVACADNTECDRKCSFFLPNPLHPVKSRARPGSARGKEKRVALLQSLQSSLLRRSKRRGELSRLGEGRVVAGRDSTMRRGEEHGIRPSAAVLEQIREPRCARLRVGDVAGFHRPFDAVAVGDPSRRESSG